MSWEAASFVVLGLVLVVGFGWYERSRPSAKVLSLVAALAALATIGRIAFAPFPNAKPTTDIALFAGYALGPVPGFAVGSIAALASNVFFGQGPWTPWQMVGWGGAGVIGGLLAAVAGRDLGRITLAAACGVAAALFGVLLDGYQWTLGAQQDLSHYLAISATSLPYNLTHVISSVAFCLLLGPGFVRALRRYRRRFEVSWAAPATVALAALALAGGALAPRGAEASTTSRAVSYLLAAQNSDGGFGGAPGQSSTGLYTGWTALGLAAAGRNPADVSRAGRTILDYLRTQAAGLSDTGDIERTILVLRAAGVSPRSFGGRDLVATLLSRRSHKGTWDRTVDHTSFGVLALRASGVNASSSVRWLASHANRDGGYGFAPHAASDADDTGAALQALVAGGMRRSSAVRRAVGYLRSAQDRDGGFGQMAGGSSNAQSTAWAVQGLVAAGRNPASLRRGGHSPISYLLSLVSSNGSVRYSRGSGQTPVWVTAQALDALERKTFPLAPAPRATRASTSKPKSAAPGHGHRGGGAHARHAKARKPAAKANRLTVAPKPPLRRAPAARSAATTHPAGHGGGSSAAWLAIAGLAGVALLAGWRLLRRRKLFRTM